MKCLICGIEIVLRPSAKERAAKYGGKASDYTSMFSTHSHCSVQQRAADVSKLMKRIRNGPTSKGI